MVSDTFLLPVLDLNYAIISRAIGRCNLMSKTKIDNAVRPFLKWVGGKGRLLDQLAKYYPKSYNKFYEPFVGGGAVFFSLKPDTAYISDTNKKLVDAYVRIRDDVDLLTAELLELEKKYHAIDDNELQKEFFYNAREQFNSPDTPDSDKVALLIFLNKTCFNGLYRENSKGGFNVPFGKYKNPKICDASNLLKVSESLKHATISCASFEEAVKSAGNDDFVYFDPPYHPVSATSSFTSYGADDFGIADQEKLRDIFVELSNRGCKVMLSNSDTPLVRELYKGFKIQTILASRSINSISTKRGKITEVVVTNY